MKTIVVDIKPGRVIVFMRLYCLVLTKRWGIALIKQLPKDAE